MSTQYSGSITLIDSSNIQTTEKQYFWFVPTLITAPGGSINPGVYISGENDKSEDVRSRGYFNGDYLYINQNGLQLIHGNNTKATLSAIGLTISQGGIIAGNNSTNNFIYLSTNDYNGTTITINGNSSGWRQIIGSNFGVKNDGSLYANNVNISGQIVASTGLIGGWKIGTDGNGTLHNNSINLTPQPGSGVIIISKGLINLTEVGILPANKNWTITAGENFGVTTDGILYSKGAVIKQATIENIIANDLIINTGQINGAVTIGGITMSAAINAAINDMSSFTTSEISKYITVINNEGIKVHQEYDRTDFIQINANWIRMFRDNKAFISIDDTGVSFLDGNQNTLAYYGTDGIILYKPGTNNAVVTIDNQGNANFQGIIRTGTKTAYNTGQGTYIDSAGNIYSGSGGTNNFTVSNTGQLRCTGAIVNGEITSISGYIGGWTITSNRIEKDNTSAGGSRCGIQNSSGSGGHAVFYAGCSTASGGSIWDESKTNFFVTNSGYLFCNNAKIEGTITANNGYVGGWTISSTYLIKDTSNNLGRLLLHSGNVGTGNVTIGVATRASTSASWDYQCYMTGNGSFVAKQATITGTINATGGNFTGTINATSGTFGSTSGNNFNLRTSGTTIKLYRGSTELASLGYDSNFNGVALSGGSVKGIAITGKGVGIYAGTSDLIIDCNQSTGIKLYSSSGAAHIWSSYVDFHISNTGVYTYADTYSAGTSSQTGKIWSGTGSHPWYRVYAVDGTVHSSDRKDKDILGSIGFAKNLIMKLKPIQYMWKNGDHRRIRMGFIAQEVAEECNKLNLNLNLYSANFKDDEGNNLPYYGEDVDDELLNWNLNYQELIAPMIQVIQNQQKEIEQLKQDIQELKNK